MVYQNYEDLGQPQPQSQNVGSKRDLYSTQSDQPACTPTVSQHRRLSRRYLTGELEDAQSSNPNSIGTGGGALKDYDILDSELLTPTSTRGDARLQHFAFDVPKLPSVDENVAVTATADTAAATDDNDQPIQFYFDFSSAFMQQPSMDSLEYQQYQDTRGERRKLFQLKDPELQSPFPVVQRSILRQRIADTFQTSHKSAD